jgi:DNA-binding response OmpR family regulator
MVSCGPRVGRAPKAARAFFSRCTNGAEWPDACVLIAMPRTVSNVLLCDEDRDQIDTLVVELAELGHYVTVARTCADAFTAACRDDFDALLSAPALRDGTTLMLPRALGIRRPRLVLLVTRLSERVGTNVARGVGFDGQLTKIVSAARVDRILRAHLKEPTKGDSLARWTSPR